MQATTFLLLKMFSKPCIVVKTFKMRKLLVFPSTLSKVTLSPCTTIPKMSQYHWFEFYHDHMIMWGYFGIGEGKRWNCTNIFFMPFSSTTSSISEGAGISKKRWQDLVIYTSVLSQDVWISSEMLKQSRCIWYLVNIMYQLSLPPWTMWSSVMQIRWRCQNQMPCQQYQVN